MGDSLPPSLFIPNFNGMTGDKRLDVRARALWNQLSKTPSSNISALSEDRPEQIAYYRLLENDKFSEDALIQELVSRVIPLATGRELLCLEDSSEINVSKNKNRLQANTGLGRSDNAENSTCFKIHPGLVIDANSLCPLGFSAIKVFERPIGQPDRKARNYKAQPIAEKESYKWIEVTNDSKKVLGSASLVTFVQDREGDIFEQFALVPDARHHLLIRSRTTRKLTDGGDLYTEVGLFPVAGYYDIDVPADKRKNRDKHVAHMEIRHGSFQVQRPRNLSGKDYPQYIAIRCVSAREVTPGVENPVHWKLLTTHEITCFEDAVRMVAWYKCRWFIEQVFRLLKHRGFGIEDTLLETGWAIRKLVLMQLSALLKIMQMNIAYNDPEGGQPIEEVFTPQETEVLAHLNKKLQGKTAKSQNNNNPKKTKWATWVIGRLGNWKGYDSQGPPGVICLKNGLDRFANIMEGVRLAKDMYTG